jgi:hypothetical protein
MKRYITGIILALMLIVSIPVKAQNDNVTVPRSMLSKDQLEQLSAKQIQDKVENYGKWVGIGHELGTAINESLSAVTTQANNFAQTPVGRLTAFLVVWKVIGHDGMGFIIGILEIIIMLPIWIWSYRRFLPRKVLDKVTFDSTTGKKILETYKVINNLDDNSRSGDNAMGFLIGHYVMLAVLFFVCMITMWA